MQRIGGTCSTTNEVWISVFQFLGAHRQSFLQLCRVSKEFRLDYLEMLRRRVQFLGQHQGRLVDGNNLTEQLRKVFAVPQYLLEETQTVQLSIPPRFPLDLYNSQIHSVNEAKFYCSFHLVYYPTSRHPVCILGLKRNVQFTQFCIAMTDSEEWMWRSGQLDRGSTMLARFRNNSMEVMNWSSMEVFLRQRLQTLRRAYTAAASSCPCSETCKHPKSN